MSQQTDSYRIRLARPDEVPRLQAIDRKHGFRDLQPTEWTPGMRKIRQQEARHGLHVEALVFMRREPAAALGSALAAVPGTPAGPRSPRRPSGRPPPPRPPAAAALPQLVQRRREHRLARPSRGQQLGQPAGGLAGDILQRAQRPRCQQRITRPSTHQASAPCRSTNRRTSADLPIPASPDTSTACPPAVAIPASIPSSSFITSDRSNRPITGGASPGRRSSMAARSPKTATL
jgi:hypothetical protein